MSDWTPSKHVKQFLPDLFTEQVEVDWAEVQLIVEMAEEFDATVDGMPLEVWLSMLPPTSLVLH
jgi:hypothetical protein